MLFIDLLAVPITKIMNLDPIDLDEPITRHSVFDLEQYAANTMIGCSFSSI